MDRLFTYKPKESPINYARRQNQRDYNTPALQEVIGFRRSFTTCNISEQYNPINLSPLEKFLKKILSYLPN